MKPCHDSLEAPLTTACGRSMRNMRIKPQPESFKSGADLPKLSCNAEHTRSRYASGRLTTHA